MNDDAKRKARELAIGRIFRLASRPAQPGDVELYADARHAFLATFDDAAIPGAVEPASSVLMRHRARFGDT